MMGMMTRSRFVILLLSLALVLAACSGGSAPKEAAAKRYQMEGEIKAVDTANKTATIAHGQIGDWMGPMTMEYPIKPDAEFQKFHAGDKIKATVVVNDLSYYVTDVKVEPK